MRVHHWALVAGLLFLGGAGCDEDSDSCICCPADTEAPAAPRGLYSITGDNEVILVWMANTEADLEGYRIWYTADPTSTLYDLLATIYGDPDGEPVEYVHENLYNGVTYYYAVTAFDEAGNEGTESYEIDDTPRSEGWSVAMGSIHTSVVEAGFDLRRGELVDADDAARCDFYFRYDDESGEAYIETGPYPTAGEFVKIQDMGFTSSLDEIDLAPVTNPDDPSDWTGAGWSPTGVVEAIGGHTYVLLTLEGPYGYYAKIRVRSVSSNYIVFDWAYQEASWNRQLAVRE